MNPGSPATSPEGEEGQQHQKARYAYCRDGERQFAPPPRNPRIPLPATHETTTPDSPARELSLLPE